MYFGSFERISEINCLITELDNAIRIAKTDWRDAILLAEYEHVEGSTPEAIYDFRNGFNKIKKTLNS